MDLPFSTYGTEYPGLYPLPREVPFGCILFSSPLTLPFGPFGFPFLFVKDEAGSFQEARPFVFVGWEESTTLPM
jgi:hypothetical protein